MEDNFTSKHYDFNYSITEKDKKRGFIKIDPYFVDKIWGISKNGGFPIIHIFKNIARWGVKNTKERETKAVVSCIFRYAELNNISLKDMCIKYLEENDEKE